MATSSFSNFTSLMVTNGADAVLAISTKSFQLSGLSSSSHKTVGRSSVINPGRRRIECPSIKATMSSFRDIRSSGCIFAPLLSQMSQGRVGFRPPDFLYAAQDMTACAAFIKDPDFLWSLLESMSLMRLSVKKAAHVDVSGASYRKSGE